MKDDRSMMVAGIQAKHRQCKSISDPECDSCLFDGWIKDSYKWQTFNQHDLAVSIGDYCYSCSGNEWMLCENLSLGHRQCPLLRGKQTALRMDPPKTKVNADDTSKPIRFQEVD